MHCHTYIVIKIRNMWYISSRDDEIEKVVTYKPNRAVLFPTDIVHYAMAPHRFFTGLRMSLAYKFFLY